MSKLSLNVTYEAETSIDLVKLINEGEIDEDEIVDAIKNRNTESILNFLNSIPGFSRKLSFELDKRISISNIDDEQVISIQIGNKTLISNND